MYPASYATADSQHQIERDAPFAYFDEDVDMTPVVLESPPLGSPVTMPSSYDDAESVAHARREYAGTCQRHRSRDCTR